MSRFECPSSSLILHHLLRLQRSLWISLALALLLHSGLTTLRGFVREQKATKPLTTQFVKRAPRLTKPLEMKKRPRPKRQPLQRRMISVKAKVNRQQASRPVHSAQILKTLAEPHIALRRSAAFEAAAFEPKAMAQAVKSTKETERMVNMSLEMLDIAALDTGRYQAMVIQDPNDKRNIRGFFHLAQALIPSAVAAQTASGGYAWDRGPTPATQAIPELVAAINEYTDIKAAVGSFIAIESREIFKTPWVLVTTQVTFKITDAEAWTLGRYLLSGGFLYADDSLHTLNSAPDKALRTMFVDALTSQRLHNGRHWDFEKIPHDHAIYHCYFDFEGPPAGLDDFGYARGWIFPPGSKPVDYLLGITIEGRMIGIETPKDYSVCWARPSVATREMNPTRQLQFGVNMIVFVLTQEGSITNQVMDSVR